MNIEVGLFVSRFNTKWSVGAYINRPDDESHHFYGAIADTEEDAIVKVLKLVEKDYDELGYVQFVTITTKRFNFLCKGKAKEEMIPSPKLRALLSDINKSKSTRFKKNEKPSEADILRLTRADMINVHIQRRNELYGETTVYETDVKSFKEMKRAYKATPNPFLGQRLFYWEPTKSVEIDSSILNVYYSGGYTPKSDTSKKDNNVSDFEKKLRRNIYTYYTGSNSKLTDAGQRSLEEIRSVTFVYEKQPVAEKFFEFQCKCLANKPSQPVFVANIDKVLGGASSKRLMDGDEHWFKIIPDSGDLIFNGITRGDMAYVFSPQRLGPRIRTQFIKLRDKFLDHLEGKLIGEEIDITHLLYTTATNPKGKVITTSNDIINGKFNFIKIPGLEFMGRKFTLKYTFGIDAPNTTIMRRLAKSNPKVSIVFEELSNTTVGYYTIVRDDMGCTIYSCPEGSKLIRRK